ncbi:S8 family peptidase [Armatimonas sp.]|uniref:S8 family peptidase n=1 Tax=Armatimonas sp. TaxID=1872638 RepID=UPI00374D17F5
MTKSLRNTLATLGIAAAVGATAVPMLSVWTQKDEVPVAQFSEAGTPILTGSVLIDFKDNVTDADIRAFAEQYGFGNSLKPNSMEAKDNRLFRVAGPINEADLAPIRNDSRVQAAEPEIRFNLDQAAGSSAPRSWRVTDPTVETTTMSDPTIHGDGDHWAYQAVDTVKIAPTEGGTSIIELVADDAPMGTKPNDPLYDKQWNFRMIDTEGAWERTRGKGAVVAVIDTGVTKARDFKQTTFTAGYNFVSKTTNADDDHGHGTHVAGTIAESTNNNEGVAGIAFEATIMPLKVLSAEGSGSSADIADAIRFAADKGANIINMSLGSMYPSDVIHEACKYARKKGVTIVCAAGNSFREGVGYPAAFPECIAVSSVGPSGKLSKFSSWGKQVALAAPGGDMIDSKDPNDGILQNTVYSGQDDYFAFQGTSMASPHVAGAAALAYSQGTKDPAKIKDLLQKTASKPKENNTKKYGAGILNVGKLTAKGAADNTWKLRHALAIGFAGLLIGFGGPLGRRNLALRAGIGAAIAGGFFVPDAITNVVGADSAWNLLSFSVLAPALLIWALRKGPGLKVASGAALGVGVNLFANWNNATIPFTTATFGTSALPWTLSNMTVALGLAVASALWAAKRLR